MPPSSGQAVGEEIPGHRRDDGDFVGPGRVRLAADLHVLAGGALNGIFLLELVLENVDAGQVLVVGLGGPLLDELLVLFDDGLGRGVVDVEAPGSLC